MYPLIQQHINSATATLGVAVPTALNTCESITFSGITVTAKMTNECVLEFYSDALCTTLAPSATQPGTLWTGVCELSDEGVAGTYKRSWCTDTAPTTIATYEDLSLFSALSAATATPPAVPVAPLVAAKKDDDVCFTGEMTVELDDGSTKRIMDTKLGDKILTLVEEQLVYAEVVFIPHQDSEKMDHSFYAISTSTGHTLEASESHLVAVASEKDGSCDYLDAHSFMTSHALIHASEATQGACVAVAHDQKLQFVPIAKVTAASRMTEMVSVVTTYAGYPVVNGIAASSFSFNHAAPSMFYNIHRLLYRIGLGGLLDSSVVKDATHAIGSVAVNVHHALF